MEKEGLQLARQELPDIILSDAMMPEMDGYTFCREIKNTPETSHIAFILLTAKTARESVVEGLQNKADDYITKPFSVEETAASHWQYCKSSATASPLLSPATYSTAARNNTRHITAGRSIFAEVV